MSLHAQLSPEAEERLRAQRRNSTISSLVISILVLVLIGLVLAFIALKGFLFESPTLVTYNAAIEEEQELEKKQINDQVQRRPSAPSSSMAKVIASTTPTPTAIPVPEIDVPDPSTDFGSGDDFGAGWGSGGDGGGGGFGNIPATMRKRCSQADRMARLEANGGNPKCEEAVMAALRYFQKTQNKDGSWDSNNKVAITGLVLLAYLGHCETPLSEEFGQTVMDAMIFLTDVATKHQGKLGTDFKNKHWSYEHAIAAYAVAESYTFCSQLNISIPNLEEACQNSIQWIINNQHKSGGWDYAYSEDSGRGGDLSVTAWQLQALKAGMHTGLDFRNMRSCILKGLDYVRDRQDTNGGFGYTGKKPVGGADGHYTLTGAGALCLQQHKGAANTNARQGIRYLDKEAKFSFDKGPCNLYEHYYNSQAMINHGGESWEKYNNLVRDELLKNQNKDGSWPSPATKGPGGGGSDNYRTALCTLMLEVYYRYLPGTGQKT